MKLLLITAIVGYENEIKQILKEVEVVSYSYKEVTGHRHTTLESMESNWFGMGMPESEAVLFYSFVKEDKVDLFFELLEKKNTEHRTTSRIHAVSINIDKSN